MKPLNRGSRPSPSRNKTFEVEQEDTLMPFLSAHLPNESRTTIKSILAHRQTSINGTPTTQFNAPLKPGDQVAVYFGRNNAPFSHSKLKIIYEDDFLIVTDKSAGLLSMATEQLKEETAYRILSDYVKKKDPRHCIFILHRLDRDTSGIIMFAKRKDIQEKLQQNWDNAVLERKYVAVLEGIPEKKNGSIKSYIAENSAYIVHSSDADNGKLAITHYQVLNSGKHYSLVELELETGRKNQIRVHMQENGHPIAGDKKYGARTNPVHRLALHAFKLSFVHPVTGKEMDFETPFPSRFITAVKNG